MRTTRLLKRLSTIIRMFIAVTELNIELLQAMDVMAVHSRIRRTITRGNRKFHIDTFHNFYHHFRMEKEQFLKLYRAFHLPEVIKVKRSKFSGLEALAITMYRLSYPYRLVDLVRSIWKISQ